MSRFRGENTMGTYLDAFSKGCGHPGCSQVLSKSIECQEKLPSNLRCPQRMNNEYNKVDITDEDLCGLHPEVPLWWIILTNLSKMSSFCAKNVWLAIQFPQ